MTDTLSPDELRYNTESLMADSLREFHRDAFDILSDSERAALLSYYPQNLDRIADVFAYRRELMATETQAASFGLAALRRVMESLGIAPDDIY